MKQKYTFNRKFFDYFDSPRLKKWYGSSLSNRISAEVSDILILAGRDGNNTSAATWAAFQMVGVEIDLFRQASEFNIRAAEKNSERPAADRLRYELTKLRSDEGLSRANPLYLDWMWNGQNGAYRQHVANLLVDVLNELRNKGLATEEDSRRLESIKSYQKSKSLRLPAPYDAVRRKFQDKITSYTQDHTPHTAEAEFGNFIAANTNGYWLISAAPGMGKTAIMASLCSKRALDTNHIAFFVEHSFHKKTENTTSGIVRYLLTYLSELFDVPIDLPKSDELRLDCLELQLFALSERGLITTEKPLLFIIDALDELSEINDDTFNSLSGLGLPNRLPPGVFFGLSTRYSLETMPTSKPFDAPYQHLVLDKGEQFLGHKNTVETYVRSKCESLPHIAPFHHAEGQDAKTEFVLMLCERSKYNFMILKSILHEELYWELGGTGRDIPDTLRQYYEEHLQRMRRYLQVGLHADATFCFAISTSISKDLLRLLMGASPSNELVYKSEKILNNWISQGLILKQKRDDIDWLSAYHRTYREFLKEKFDEQDKTAFLLRYLNEIIPENEMSETIQQKALLPNVLKEEWLRITSRLLIQSQRANYFEEYICDPSLWALAASTPNGYESILPEISKFKPIPSERINFQDCYSKLGRVVYAHLQNDDHKRKITLQEFLKMTRDSSVGIVDEGTISFFMDLANAYEEDPDRNDDDIKVRIEILFEILRGGRISLQYNVVEETLGKLTEILASLDDQYGDFQLSKLYYDRGAFARTRGEYDTEIKMYEKSAEYGWRAEDHIGALFAELCMYVAQYLSVQIGPSDFYENLLKLRDKMDELTEVPDDRQVFLMRSKLNVLRFMVEVLYELNAEEFLKHLQLQEDHEVFVRQAQGNDPMYGHLRLSHAARKEFVNGNTEKAIKLFSSYKVIDGEDFSGSVNLEKNRPITHYLVNKCDRAARDYRDFGRILLSSDLPDRKKKAVAVLQAGKALGYERGNMKYVKDIEQDLKESQSFS